MLVILVGPLCLQQTSGGTVLSTNWSEVKGKNYEAVGGFACRRCHVVVTITSGRAIPVETRENAGRRQARPTVQIPCLVPLHR